MVACKMWGQEESSDGVLLVFKDCWVGEKASESELDPVEIRFDHHASISPTLSLGRQVYACAFFN